jgi:hypothetical protein
VAQSLAPAQTVLQAVASHAYAPHGFGTSPHLPAPSHVLGCDSIPAAHALAPHAVLVGGYTHVVAVPLHAIPHVVPMPTPLHAVRVPCGAPTTPLHVPTLPATSQALHCSVHAVVQQTPSAH